MLYGLFLHILILSQPKRKIKENKIYKLIKVIKDLYNFKKYATMYITLSVENIKRMIKEKEVFL